MQVPWLSLLRSEETQAAVSKSSQVRMRVRAQAKPWVHRVAHPSSCSFPVQGWGRVETGLCRQDPEEKEVGAAFKLRSRGWEVGSWRKEALGLPQNQPTLPVMG